MPATHRDGLLLALKVCAAAACLALSACGGMRTSGANPINWLTPYKAEVIQGNFVSSEQAGLLKAGMTRAQVKDILGTPLLASVFHSDRWDYVFTLKRQKTETQSFKYTLFFKGDELERFEGDTLPSESDFIAKLDSRRKLGKVPVLEATPEQLKAAEKSTAARAADAAAAPAATAPGSSPPGSYPPLEGVAR